MVGQEMGEVIEFPPRQSRATAEDAPPMSGMPPPAAPLPEALRTQLSTLSDNLQVAIARINAAALPVQLQQELLGRGASIASDLQQLGERLASMSVESEAFGLEPEANRMQDELSRFIAATEDEIAKVGWRRAAPAATRSGLGQAEPGPTPVTPQLNQYGKWALWGLGGLAVFGAGFAVGRMTAGARRPMASVRGGMRGAALAR